MEEELKAMFRVCNATKNDGVRCGSPALTGINFCWQHMGGKVPSTRAKATTSDPGAKLKLVYPGDRQAIQHNLFLVLQALNDGKIDTATANTFNRIYRTCEQNLRQWQEGRSSYAKMRPLPDEKPEAGAGAPSLEETWDNNQAIPTGPGSPQPALNAANGTGLHPCVETATTAYSQTDDEEDEPKRRYREWKQSPEGQAYQRTWGKLDSDFSSRLAKILDPNTDSDTPQPGSAAQIHTAIDAQRAKQPEDAAELLNPAAADRRSLTDSSGFPQSGHRSIELCLPVFEQRNQHDSADNISSRRQPEPPEERERRQLVV